MEKPIQFIGYLIAFISLLVLMSTPVLAYGYGSSNYHDYNDYSFTSTKTHGSSYGPSYSKSVNFDRRTSVIYDHYGGYQKRTSYIRTETSTPSFYNNYYAPSRSNYRTSYPYNSYRDSYYYNPSRFYTGSYYNWRY